MIQNIQHSARYKDTSSSTKPARYGSSRLVWRWEIPEKYKFQYFREYMITVYKGLDCENIIFEGQVDSPKIINLLYDDVERHYHVIVNIKLALAKRSRFKVCNNWCAADDKHLRPEV
jgi:hypothetical protein